MLDNKNGVIAEKLRAMTCAEHGRTAEIILKGEEGIEIKTSCCKRFYDDLIKAWGIVDNGNTKEAH